MSAISSCRAIATRRPCAPGISARLIASLRRQDEIAPGRMVDADLVVSAHGDVH